MQEGIAISVTLNDSTKLAKRWLRDTRARLVVGLVISLTLGWLSVRGMEWGLVADQFQEFPIGWAVAALAFSYGVVLHAVLFLPPIIVAVIVFSRLGLTPLKRRDSPVLLPVIPAEGVAVSIDRGARR